MLVRFRRDVIDLNPRAVVIMAGINDIALNNGFAAINSFYVSFKKQYGMTPAQYRKQNNVSELLEIS